MAKKQLFRGVGTAIVTPFCGEGIDFDTFGRLLDRQREYADAVIVAGTTGEAPTLSEAERDALLDFALTRVGDALPVWMGVGSNDTAHAVRLARRADALGAHALLCVTPYYNRGTREGMRTHFLRVAEAAQAPLVLYNVPARTGCSLSLADYGALLDHPNILGVKEAEADAAKMGALCGAFGEGRAIYTGADEFLLPALALGASGVISVVSNAYPDLLHGVIRNFDTGDTQRARRAFLRLLPLVRLLFAETSPAPIKEVLRLQGFGDGACRLPLSFPSDSLRAALAEEISRLSGDGTY